VSRNLGTDYREGATRRRCRAALLATLLALPVAGLARERHVLWSVAGAKNTVYLLGSIHVLRPEDGELPGVVNAAYADAERLVMEIDMDDALADPSALVATMQKSALLPADQSLRTVLGVDYPHISESAAAVGLDLAALDQVAPWFVATTILQLELARRGFSPDLGVEQTLTRRAVADHKPIDGLETADQQFAILAGLPMAEQKRFLSMTLEEVGQLDAEVQQMVGAWRAGDVEGLAKLLTEEYDEFPELYRPLTEDRNRAWATKLVALLHDNDDYLVVVGALHLVGPHSVVELLRERGYDVEQQ
jgi:uncharacterized protein YbaP (TraB family)